MTIAATNDLRIDQAVWQTGLTLEAFVDGIDTYQEETRRRLRAVQLTPAERAAFAQQAAPVYALVWYADSLQAATVAELKALVFNQPAHTAQEV